MKHSSLCLQSASSTFNTISSHIAWSWVPVFCCTTNIKAFRRGFYGGSIARICTMSSVFLLFCLKPVLMSPLLYIPTPVMLTVATLPIFWMISMILVLSWILLINTLLPSALQTEKSLSTSLALYSFSLVATETLENSIYGLCFQCMPSWSLLLLPHQYLCKSLLENCSRQHYLCYPCCFIPWFLTNVYLE